MLWGDPHPSLFAVKHPGPPVSRVTLNKFLRAPGLLPDLQGWASALDEGWAQTHQYNRIQGTELAPRPVSCGATDTTNPVRPAIVLVYTRPTQATAQMLTLPMSPPGKKGGGTGFQELWRMPCQSCGGGQGQPAPIGIRCTSKDIRLMLNITHHEGITFEKFYLSSSIALKSEKHKHWRI